MPNAFVSSTRAPGRVDLHRPLVARADAFAPVIFIREAAARPTHHRHFQFLQRLDDVVAIAARVRNLRVLADPDSLVDAVAQVLRELAIDVAIDLGARLVGPNGHGETAADSAAPAAQATKLSVARPSAAVRRMWYPLKNRHLVVLYSMKGSTTMRRPAHENASATRRKAARSTSLRRSRTSVAKRAHRFADTRDPARTTV